MTGGKVVIPFSREWTVIELGRFISQHDGCRLVGSDRITGNIYVESDAVIDGKVVRVEDEIPATMKAVRDWLGY